MKNMKEGVSRRGFLEIAGATLGASALAATGVLENHFIAEADELIEPEDSSASISELNPQDETYNAYTTDYSALFEPLQIGSLTLRNRFVKSAAGSDTFIPESTELNENYLSYYENFAKGGTAMVWLEGDPSNMYNISIEDHTIKGFMSADNAADLIRPVAQRIHDAGGYVGMQFFTMSFTCNDMTPEDIAFVRDAIVNLAVKLHDGDIDAIEINASAAHFGNSFLSRATNMREDEYGAGSLEDRTRFHVELVQAIKEACGSDFVIEYLINGVEENDNILGANDKMETIEEAIENAQALEAAGVDSFYIRSSVPSMHIAQFAPDLQFAGYQMDGNTALGNQFDYSKHYEGMANGQYSGVAFNMKMAAEIKKHVNVPVGCSGYMDPRTAPDLMNNAIANGEIDFMLMTRPLTVDPEMPNKLQAGKRDEVAPCTRCMHCHDRSKGGREICRVNAATQRAYTEEMPEGYDPLPTDAPKNVMVVGGGPAGMEAARIAAQRGHSVSLYERDSTLGGLVKAASVYKGTHERLNDLIDYLAKQQEVCGVNVVLETEVTADTVAEQNPDVVVLAVGGIRPTKLSSASIPVYGLNEIVGADLGENVVICGAGAQAIDCAAFLLAQGKSIQMINEGPAELIDKEQSYWYRTYLVPFLYSKGVRIWNNATIQDVSEDGLNIILDSGNAKTLACDSIVECYDMVPNDELKNALGSSYTVVEVGDGAAPNNIAYAIGNANLAARAI